jgi:hypothetical protein
MRIAPPRDAISVRRYGTAPLSLFRGHSHRWWQFDGWGERSGAEEFAGTDGPYNMSELPGTYGPPRPFAGLLGNPVRSFCADIRLKEDVPVPSAGYRHRRSEGAGPFELANPPRSAHGPALGWG